MTCERVGEKIEGVVRALRARARENAGGWISLGETRR